MSRIEKYLPTNKAAEKFLDRLYSEYNRVQCVHIPMFSEAGVYVFICE
jgi:hypothetical protein